MKTTRSKRPPDHSKWPMNAQPDLMRGILYDACVKQGYCVSESDQERIATTSFGTIGDFAKELMRTEGMDYTSYMDLFHGLCEMVHRRIVS